MDAEVSFTVKDQNAVLKGQCKNLSHSGIRFETENLLDEGTDLLISIDTKSEKFSPMSAIVKILRVEPSEDNRYSIAGRILEFK